MKRVTLVVGILIAVLLVFAFFSRMCRSANAPHEMTFGLLGGNFHDGLRGLRPTRGQREKLMQEMMKLDQACLPMRLEESKKKIELSEMLLDPNVKKEALSAKLQEILKIEAQRQELLLDTYFNIASMLNPAQKQVFSHLVIHKILSGKLQSGFEPEGGFEGPSRDRESFSQHSP